MKVIFETLGCWKNVYDSEKIINWLIKETNLNITDKLSESNIIIINTCCFIKNARDENDEIIGYYHRLKEIKPEIKLIIYGCYVQLYKEELKTKFPLTDKMFLISEKDEMLKYLKELASKSKRHKERIEVATYLPHIKFLKISEGCDNRCNYCQIPAIRGPLNSKEQNEIIDEIKEFEEKQRIREYIIIGQDTMSYRKDKGEKNGIIKLLEEIIKIIKDKERWIRVMYMHPKNFNFDIIKLMKNEEKICKYFDIPIQHSEDKILEKMNRGYNKKDIYKIVESIRKEIPEAAIRTTIITGHPEENKEDYKNLINFLKEIKFDYAGFYNYSLEKFSNDYNLYKECKINDKEQKSKIEELENIQSKIIEEKTKKVKSKLKLLIDECNENIYYGRTEFQAPEIDNMYELGDLKEEIEIGEFYNIDFENEKVEKLS